MSLSTIRNLLAAHGLHPRHRFGQNFLHDENKLRLIVEAAEVSPGDRVLEVGPGTGALTAPLLDAGAVVTAVEIDRDLFAILQEQFADRANLALHCCDVMDGKHAIAPAVAAAIDDAPAGSVKLVANLPYNIASPLLAVLAADHPAIGRGVVMVQKEVADRMAAPPGGKQFGPLSVILQAMFDVRTLCRLSPNCFWPKPTIESAVITLDRRVTPLTRNPERLSAFAGKLFQQRRKQIGSTLGRGAVAAAGFDPSMRTEQLGVEQIEQLRIRLETE